MKWFLAMLGLLLVGLVLRLNLLVYAMYVLAGVLALSRFFTRVWTEQVTAKRICPTDRAGIGDEVEMEVQVENGGKWTVPWLLVEDALPHDALVQTPPRIKVEGPRLALRRLGPGESVTPVHYRATFLMRGYYQLGPLLVETGDVFGLHRRYKVIAEPHFVLVPPKVLPLLGYSLASRRPLGEIRVAHRLFEDPTRLAGVRLYQKGDPLNRIHWRATARTGELHSRVYESSRVVGATLLLDFHAHSYEGPAGNVSAELAVVTVASIANAVHLMGQQIGLASNGRDAADRLKEEGWTAEFKSRAEAVRQAKVSAENTRLRPVQVPTGRGDERFQAILEILARLEFTDGLDFSGMLEQVAARIPRDATVIAVVRHVTPAIAVSLGEMARNGFLVMAMVVMSGAEGIPDWAKPPDWAAMLLDQGVDFRLVNSEDAVSQLCAEAIVK